MRFLASADDKPYTGQPNGVAAIWNAGADGSDNSGLLDPRNNLGKVWFHSDLDYLRIVKTVTSLGGDYSPAEVPATPYNAPLNAEYTLFAHGLGYKPLISGDIITSGYRQPCAGSPAPIPAGDRTQAGYRYVGMTADETYIYLHVRGFIAPAMTIHWEVRLYEETFQNVSEASSLIYFSPESATLAALGKVSADRRFVRKVPSGSGQFRFLGQQTMKLVTAGSGPTFHFSDGVLDLKQFKDGTGAFSTGGSLHASGVECEITGGTPRGSGFTYDADGIEIANGSDVVFTTARAMEVSLGQIKGTLNIPAVSGSDYFDNGGHTVDYDIAAVPAGTTLVRGFGQFANATDFLPAARNFDFTGSVILQAAATTYYSSGNSIVGIRFVSPIITGGRFKIRDQYFALINNPHIDLLAVTLNYDIRTVAFVGGI